MEDVTPLFNNYRECVRRLWNAYYRALPDGCRDFDLYDEFDDIAVTIFSSIVLRSLGIFDHKLAAGYVATPQTAYRLFRYSAYAGRDSDHD